MAQSVSTRDAEPSSVTKTGVKMTGPYLYVAPPYWLLDRKHSGTTGSIPRRPDQQSARREDAPELRDHLADYSY
jgi:hypothetical protein